MIARFTGPDGARVVIDTLRRQQIVQGREDIAAALRSVADLKQYAVGDYLIRQGGADSEVFLLLAGEVVIAVNGRAVASRRAGQHVGEMALIDPSKPRSADVSAVSLTVAAVLTEPDFSKVAEAHPRLWRMIALELSDRLRERSKFHSPPNVVPEIFIGCSSEMLSIAEALQLALSRRACLPKVWTDSFFKPSLTNIESLFAGITKADFAFLVFGPDDVLASRGVIYDSPRDNVILELGMSIGALGRQRAFIVHERGVDVKIPTDLLGVTPLSFVAGTPETISARIAPVVTEAWRLIETFGPK